MLGALLALGATGLHDCTEAAQAAGTGAAPLGFQITQGLEINRFLRAGAVAAHLVLRSGHQPRILVAFPAGDSGIAVWLEPSAAAVHWRSSAALRAIVAQDQRGRTLRGIQTELVADAATLQIKQVLLSSVRVLRDYEASGRAPTQVLVSALRSSTVLSWSRDRLDGASGYQLSIEALDGTRITAGTLVAGPDGQLHLRLRALTGEPPLTPLAGRALLTATARVDRRERDVLSYLSYTQKYLAGSWRFDSYFGRDTLIALRLLAPVLQPTAMAGGIASVLARLSPQGEVAHEEAIGEYAILLNEAAGRGLSAAPIYSYSMLDEDFLLAPVVAYWLLDNHAGAAGAAQFLARRCSGQNPVGASTTGTGADRNGDALVRNLRFVLHRTAAFAAVPRFTNLVGLKPGQRAGDWRDSPDGLDGGFYPYDVNVALVPAALAAIERLTASGLLAPYLSDDDRRALLRAGRQRRVWLQAAPALFKVRIDHAAAAARVRSYALRLRMDTRSALAALQHRGITFAALALDKSGRALPIMQSDDSFMLLFDLPSPAQLQRTLDTVSRSFPAGLLTPVGLLIANPTYADGASQARFTRSAYHGTVIWAWQQALLLAGLDRQLTRRDLSDPLHARLRAARRQLWSAIEAGHAFRSSELWSWSYHAGRYQPEPFQPATGETEADAAQLWSTVLLALGSGQ